MIYWKHFSITPYQYGATKTKITYKMKVFWNRPYDEESTTSIVLMNPNGYQNPFSVMKAKPSLNDLFLANIFRLTCFYRRAFSMLESGALAPLVPLNPTLLFHFMNPFSSIQLLFTKCLSLSAYDLLCYCLTQSDIVIELKNLFCINCVA